MKKRLHFLTRIQDGTYWVQPRKSVGFNKGKCNTHSLPPFDSTLTLSDFFVLCTDNGIYHAFRINQIMLIREKLSKNKTIHLHTSHFLFRVCIRVYSLSTLNIRGRGSEVEKRFPETWSLRHVDVEVLCCNKRHLQNREEKVKECNEEKPKESC